MIESSHVGSTFGGTGDGPVIPSGPVRRGELSEDPRRALRSMTRRLRLIFVLMVVGGAIGWFTAAIDEDTEITPIAIDRYQASHVIVIDTNVPDTQTTLSVRNLNVLAKRITSGELPERVAERAEMTPTDAANQVRVLIRSDSESLEIVTVGRTPAQAEQLADLYADELFGHLEREAEAFAADAVASAVARVEEAEENLAATREALEAARAAEDDDAISLLEQDEQQYLSARIFANATLLDVRSDGVPVVPLESLQEADGNSIVISDSRFDELVNRARAGRNIEILFGDETETSSSNGALSVVSSRLPDGVAPRVAVGALAGLIAGVIIAMFLNRLDNRVRSKRQVEDLLDLPVLAEIPTIGKADRESAELLSRLRPRSRFAEQYRGLASTIIYARRIRSDEDTQVVMVTSPGQAEGKTTTVSNLGAMLAEAGQRVLLVDGDFRRPRLHHDLVKDHTPLALHGTDVPGVDIVANVIADADTPPTEILAAQRDVIELARGRYDVVLIDTAPLLATNDAVDLVDLVDDVLIVVRAGDTTVQAADRAAEALERRRAHVLGVAINAVDSNSAEDYYYYGSYYTDRHAGPRGPRNRPRIKLSVRRRSRRDATIADHVESVPVDHEAVETDLVTDIDVAETQAVDTDAVRTESDAFDTDVFDNILSGIHDLGAESDDSDVPYRSVVDPDGEIDELALLFARLQVAHERAQEEKRAARRRRRSARSAVEV